MSSRVQKGNTVFRPVAKARSRAPTAAVPFQTSSGLSNPRTFHEDNPTLQSLSQAASFIAPPEPQPIPILLPQQQNEMIDSLFSAHGIDLSGPPIHSDSPPVLVNTSNLPSSFNVGRNSISMPQQDNRPPVVFPHPFDISHELAMMTSGPSQQTPVIFTASGQPVEFTNPSIPPVFDNSQQISASENSSRQQAQGIYSEKPRRKKRIDNDGITSQPKSSSTTPRQRQSRGPSLPPFDPNVDPGEDIDPTVVTMATLCNDTGQGRVSSKATEILTSYVAWKARSRERRTRMRVAMEAKKYGRQVEQETQHPLVPLADAATPNDSNENAGQSTLGTDEQNSIDYSQQMETSRYNVQVRIGPNGETIIDEESLVVDRAENEDTSGYIHVVESDHTKFVNSGTYGKRYRGSRWSAEETDLFYNALSQYGENYELIAYVLPGRDRKSCKNKFKAEDKKNHARINYCLNNRIPVDMKTLERMTGKDFSGPIPEIRAPPRPVIQLEPSQEQGSAEETTSRAAPTKQVKKRGRSRTACIPEEGVVIVGDIDNVSLQTEYL